MADLNIQLILRLVDRATGPARAAMRAMEGQGDRLKAAGRAQLALSAQQIAAAQDRSQQMLGEAAAIAGTGYAMVQALRPAIEFEAAMAEVSKVVEFNEANGITRLGTDIQKLVTSGGLAMTAEGVADIVAAIGQTGLIDANLPDDEKTRQLIDFAEAAGKMGVAFGIPAAEAGQSMAKWRDQMGLNQQEAEALGDAVNHLSNRIGASAPGMVDVIARNGAFARAVGLSTEEIASLSAAFVKAAPSPEIAATAMKNFTSAMVAGETMTAAQVAVMDRLGIGSSDLARRMGTDAKGAIIDVMTQLSKLPAYEQSAALSQLFGEESVAAIAPLLTNVEGLRAAFEMTAHETRYAGSMMEEYEKIAGTTQSALKVLGNWTNRLATEFGTALLPALNDMMAAAEPVIGAVINWVAANPDLIKAIAWIAVGLLGMRTALFAVRFAIQPLLMAFWMFNGLLGAGVWLFGSAVNGASRFSIALAYVARAVQFVGRVMLIAGRAMLANPILLVIAAIAAGAYLIYANWDVIGPWFARLWDGITWIFGGFIDFVAGVFTGDLGRAIGGLKEMWGGLGAVWETLWKGLGTNLQFVWDNVIKPVTDKLGLTDHITAAWDAVKASFDVILGGIQSAFSVMWEAVSPIIEGLKWVADGGGALVDKVGAMASAAMSPSGWFGGSVTAAENPAGEFAGAASSAEAGQRALGGPVRAGMIYRWNEQGREMFMPRVDGEVISHRHVRALQAMQQQGGIRVVAAPGGASGGAVGGMAGGAADAAPRFQIGGITINAAPGQSPADIARAVRRELAEAARQRGFALHDGGAA